MDSATGAEQLNARFANTGHSLWAGQFINGACQGAARALKESLSEEPVLILAAGQDLNVIGIMIVDVALRLER